MSSFMQGLDKDATRTISRIFEHTTSFTDLSRPDNGFAVPGVGMDQFGPKILYTLFYDQKGAEHCLRSEQKSTRLQADQKCMRFEFTSKRSKHPAADKMCNRRSCQIISMPKLFFALSHCCLRHYYLPLLNHRSISFSSTQGMPSPSYTSLPISSTRFAIAM